MSMGPWTYLTGRPTPRAKRAQHCKGVSFSNARVTLELGLVSLFFFFSRSRVEMGKGLPLAFPVIRAHFEDL